MPTQVEQNKKYYVIFNEWNGEIIQVLSKLPKEFRDTYLETTSPLAGKILTGSINENNYLVSFVDEDELGIIEHDVK